MIRQKFLPLLIFVILSLLVSNCGQGQLFGPTLTPSPTITPTPIPIDFDEVVDAVSKVMTDRSYIYAFVLCHLEPAVWGNFNTVVRVSSQVTSDLQSHDFEINNGKFYDRISSTNPSGLASVSEEEHVFISSQDEAFKRGVPYFISNAVFETPTLIRFVVTSNPNRPVESVVKRLIWNFTGDFSGTSQLISGADPISPSLDPQEQTYELNSPFDEGKEVFLSLAKSFDDKTYCLMSNEIDLSTVQKK